MTEGKRVQMNTLISKLKRAEEDNLRFIKANTEVGKMNMDYVEQIQILKTSMAEFATFCSREYESHDGFWVAKNITKDTPTDQIYFSSKRLLEIFLTNKLQEK